MNSPNTIFFKCHCRTFCPKFGIKANVWGAKYNQAKGQKVWRLVVPKTLQKDYNRFENFIDKQSGEDSGFLIRKQSLWTKFVQHQEDRLHESGDRVRFTMAESIGLQDQVMTWGSSRESERYVFDFISMFDHHGKKLSPVDCVFFPNLSVKKDSLPLLKGIRYVYLIIIIIIVNIYLCICISVPQGGRDIFAEVTRVSTPNNFYACQLSLAAGFGMFHGMLLRRVTAGQLPVVSISFSSFASSLCREEKPRKV